MKLLALLGLAKEWIVSRVRGDVRVITLQGDTLPKKLPQGKLVRMVDHGEDWSAGFRCPCGCNEVIELLLLPDVEPNWSLSVDPLGRATLQPSVWKRSGCKSHFFLVHGRVKWV